MRRTFWRRRRSPAGECRLPGWERDRNRATHGSSTCSSTVGAEIVVYPLFEEYKYSRARTYRRYDISKMVRYVAILRPADSFSLRFERLEPVLLFSSKLRVAITRLIAAATRGPRAS